MKNWDITTSFFKNLWKDKEGEQGITWLAIGLETDKKSLVCYLCIASFVIFEIECKKQ